MAIENPTNITFSESGDSVFQNVYIYGKLNYDFDNDDITVKSLNITGPSNVTDLTVSGNLNVTGSNTKIGQDIVTRNLKVTGIATISTIKDNNGSTGSAGQVLSTDGSDLEWINTSSANVGSASKVGVNLDSDSATTMYMTFVDATSGNEEIRVDKSLTYKPSTGSFLGLTTFTDIKSTSLHVTGGVKDTSGDVGSSGQVLSATGTVGGGTNWINVGDISAGTASSISVTANSANKDQYIPFLNETSGTQQVRADAGLKYNPNTDTLKPGRISLADDDEIRFGNNNDLKISHTDSLSGQNDSNGDSVLAGTTWCSYIKETGTGPLVFKTDGGPSSGAFQFYDTSWRPILKLFSGTGARASLYYAGSEKLITSSTGIDVTGTVAATSLTASSSATLTASDVSSGVTKVLAETGNDNVVKHASAAAVRTFLNVADGATNVTNNNQLTNGAGYITSAPSSDAHMTVFTSNGTFSPPSGTSSYIVWVTGGGGGSGAAKGEFDDSNVPGYSGAGGGGGTAVRRYNSGEMGSSASVTVGGGGSGGTGSGGGSQGGHTEFNPNGSGATLSAWGGGGSSAANETTTNGGGGGGTASGQFDIPGQGGGRGNSNKDSEGSSSNITQGGETYWGDNAYGRGGDGRNRTSDGWQNGVSGAHGICIVYSF